MTRLQKSENAVRASPLRFQPQALRRGVRRTSAGAVAYATAWCIAIASVALAQPADEYQITGSAVVAGGPLMDDMYNMHVAVGQDGVGTLVVDHYALHVGFLATVCTPMPYADIAPPWIVVDVDDLIILLNGFADPISYPEADIFPCNAPDGLVDVDDLIAMLAAFAGEYLCPFPCR